MDFQLTEEQIMLKKMVHDLAEKEFRPNAAKWDEEEKFPWENLRSLARQNLLGVTIPEEYGGGGAGIMEYALIIEEIARVCANTAVIVLGANSVGGRILHFGTEEQREKYLPAIAKGERIGVSAITEPDAGSDVRSIKTIARQNGDHFVINGRKIFITRGAVGEIFVVTLKVAKEGQEPKPGFMIVEKGNPGFTIGKVEKTLGLRGNPSTELMFDDCVVPGQNLLKEGELRNVLTGLNIARCGNATVSLGIAQGAFEEALKYSQQRVQFGRELARLQGIQWMLADMFIKIEAARLLIYRAAVNAAKGYPSALEASVAKTFSNEMALEVANMAIQIHGGYGYSREFPVERMMRDARGFLIAGGTVQIQRNIIASRLVKTKKEKESSTASISIG